MNKQRLYITPTESIEIGGSKSLSSEIATRDRISYQNLAMWLPNPDPVLRKAGKTITVYQEVLADAHVDGCAQNRAAGVLSMQHGIDKGKSKSRQAKIIETWLANLDMRRIIQEMLDAAQYGYAPMEILWDNTGGLWLPKDIVGKPQEWFVYDNENKLRLLSTGNPTGEVLPERKFVVARNRASYNNPYGIAVLSRCFWPAVFKKGGLKFWVTFCEKYGAAFALGKSPRGTADAENQKLLDSLSALIQDGVGVIPDDSSVDIKESAGKTASGQLYQSLRDDCKREISMAQVGHEGGAQSTPGKLGNDNTAIEVRSDIADGDATMVAAAMNQVIAWIWELNFTGDRPVWSLWRPDEVDDTLAKRDETLTRQGVRFKKSYFQENYGFGDDEFEVVEPPPAAPGTGPSFSERPAGSGNTSRPSASSDFPDQAAIDGLIASFSDSTLQNHMEPVIKPILDLFEQSSDYNDAMSKLVSLYPKMSTNDLTEVLSRAMFVSKIWGRLNGNL